MQNNHDKVMTKSSIEKLKKLIKKLNLPKLSYAERERRYRQHMMEKYGPKRKTFKKEDSSEKQK